MAAIGTKDVCFDDEIKNFIDWCDINHLVLNVSKIQEMIVDPRQVPPEGKYFGGHMNFTRNYMWKACFGKLISLGHQKSCAFH